MPTWKIGGKTARIASGSHPEDEARKCRERRVDERRQYRAARNVTEVTEGEGDGRGDLGHDVHRRHYHYGLGEAL